jgi:hypothetical protein
MYFFFGIFTLLLLLLLLEKKGYIMSLQENEYLNFKGSKFAI